MYVIVFVTLFVIISERHFLRRFSFDLFGVRHYMFDSCFDFFWFSAKSENKPSTRH